MKSKVTGSIIILLLALAPLLMSGQNPPSPNWGNDPGNGNNPIGGAAPIGGGLVTMLVLAAGYGSRKLYSNRKRILE